MPFAYEGIARQAFVFEDAASFNAVTYIGERAVTFDIGRIAPEDADVVEHGCLFNELKVDVESAASRTFECLVGNKTGVYQQDLEQRPRLVIMGYDFFWNQRKTD